MTTDPSTPDNAQDPPKLIIDTDWKAQAQAEKEKLAEKEAEQADQGPETQGPPGAMPPADFRTLLGSLATQALLYLGGFPDPETGRAVVSIDHAKHYIDLLGILETKTNGNLTDEESKELTGVLAELRSQFVHVSQAVVSAMASQPNPGMPGAPPPTIPPMG